VSNASTVIEFARHTARTGSSFDFCDVGTDSLRDSNFVPDSCTESADQTDTHNFLHLRQVIDERNFSSSQFTGSTRKGNSSVHYECNMMNTGQVNAISDETLGVFNENFVHGSFLERITPTVQQLSTRAVQCERNYLTDIAICSDDSIIDPDYVPNSDIDTETSEDSDVSESSEIQEASRGHAKKSPKRNERSNSAVSNAAVGGPVDGVELSDMSSTTVSCGVPVDKSKHEGDLDNRKRTLHLTAKTVTSGRKQVYDKVHFCTFCEAIVRCKILVHKKEPVVKKILELPKRCKERMNLLRQLSNEGNFKHNIDAIKKGDGEIVVGRRSTLKQIKASDYTVCEFCRKWQSKKNLWRHMKGCHARVEYFQSHPSNDVSDDGKKKKIMGVKHGQELIHTAIFEKTDDNLIELFRRMRDDDIKSIVIADELICHEAGLRMAGLGQKIDHKQDDVFRVSQAVRTLGRLVMLMRQTKPGISLHNVIEPSNFDQVVKIAKAMSVDKGTPALNLGRMLGYLLRRACESKYCMALRKCDCAGQTDATAFKKLIDREWNMRVVRTAARRINREKRSKTQVIPLTEDLQRFRSYLVENIRELTEKLKKRVNSQDWVMLAKCTMSRLILFNKRRRAEVRELKVVEYLARPKWKEEQPDEMDLALSRTDRILAERCVFLIIFLDLSELVQAS
jgi:hypothetical protein